MFKNLLLIMNASRPLGLKVESGQCSAHGFEINVNGISWRTKNYNQGDFFPEYRRREYHAAEHKAFILLWQNMTPSQENFKKCPKTIVNCGMSYLVFMFLTGLFLTYYLFLIPFNIFAPSVYLLYYGISMLSFWLLLLVRWFCEKKVIAIILALIALPAALPGLIAERRFTLKEPLPEIVDEAIELVNKINSSPRHKAGAFCLAIEGLDC